LSRVGQYLQTSWRVCSASGERGRYDPGMRESLADGLSALGAVVRVFGAMLREVLRWM